LQNITSVKIEDRRMCIKSCWKRGWVGGKGVNDWMDQNKVYPQWGYILNPYEHQIRY
jgi:hypothetical protein